MGSNTLTQLRQAVEHYNQQMMEVSSKLKFGDGLLGLGRDPKREPYHMEFYQAVEGIIQTALRDGITPEEAGKCAWFLLTLDASNQYHLLTQPMREAVQGHILPLVEHLAAGEAAELALWFAHQYPKAKRLPIQKKLFIQLNKRGKL